MNEQLEKTDEFLDVDFGENTTDYTTVPKGLYDVLITNLAQREKSESKVRSDLAMRQKEHPQDTIDDIDKFQWIWTLEIVAGEYEGETIRHNTTRTFSDRSNAGKLAAAALGMKKYERALARQMAQAAGVSGSKLLMGKKLTVFVTEDEDTQGRMWNNVKECSVWEAPRARQRVQNGSQAPVTPDPSITLTKDDFWPEDELTPTA